MPLRLIQRTLFLSFAYLWAPSLGYGFPEMVRHGYVNCTSCHVSPTGGGVLTQYGRELSNEVLSAWGKESENRFLYSIEEPEWLNLGGDIRAIQTYRDTPRVRSSRLFLMQADLEAAATFKQWTIAASAGIQESRETNESSKEFISRRHYVLFRTSDELTFRVGRFLYAFGINTPDHVIATKRALQINDQGFESYNLEGAWIGEQIGFFATAILGRPDAKELKRDTGVSLQASYGFEESYKAGVSFLYGSNPERTRKVFGPYGILGFTKNFFLLTELDFQASLQNPLQNNRQNNILVNQTWGMANYQRLNYEFTQGMHLYLTQELSRSDFQNAQSISKAYGIGLQFFPRPHIEINMSWQLQKIGSSPNFSDFAWILFHFYP